MIIKIKVLPNSSKAEVIQINENSYQVKVKSAPVKNMANMELIKLLSKYFKVSQREVNIVTGMRNKNKVIEINNNYRII